MMHSLRKRQKIKYSFYNTFLLYLFKLFSEKCKTIKDYETDLNN